MSYTLAIGSASPVSLDSLNINGAVLDSNSDGEDALTLSIHEDISSAQLIAPFQKCTLRDSGGTIRFIGWLDSAPSRATGRSQTSIYRLDGPMRWLKRIPYSQSRAGLVILGGSAGSGAVSAPVDYSVAVADICASASSYINPPTGVAGLYPFTIPPRFRSDITCYDALQSVFKLTPSASIQWDYTTTLPTLNIIKSETSIVRYINAATYQLTSADLRPRYDLLADTIQIMFVRDNQPNGSYIYGVANGDAAGDAGALGANRRVWITYDVSVINSLPSTNIAQILSPTYFYLNIEGSVKKPTISWDDKAGDILGFSGTTLTRFASYRTLCSVVSRDLYQEETTLSLGILPTKLLYKVTDFDTGTPSGAAPHNNSPPISVDVPNVVTCPDNTDSPSTTTACGSVTHEDTASNTTTTTPRGTTASCAGDGGAPAAQYDCSSATLTDDYQSTQMTAAGINGTDGTTDFSANSSGFTVSDAGGTSQLNTSGLLAPYAEITGSLDVGANISAGGNINADGNIEAQGNIVGTNGTFDYINVSGAADIGGNASIGGNISVAGSVTAGADSFSAIEIERCDGKKMKVLGTGWA